jgi:hypothetical protein
MYHRFHSLTEKPISGSLFQFAIIRFVFRDSHTKGINMM